MNLLISIIQEHAPAAAEHAESPNVFALTANVSFWTLIIFLILLFVLAKFAFPPILGYAAAREKRIQEAIDDAARQRAETERLLEEQRQLLASARNDAQGLISEAQKDAERVRRDLLERARVEQEEMLARTRREIDDERARAIESLRREAVDLAIAAASKLVEKRVDAQEDRRIVTEFLAHIDKGAAVGSRS
ncbi:MAG TPA: F0F1 ATP synthase subunit B [Longimicrobiales bacterium]|nr:F0F1 ATP synthase subunit B [Longimicrobiales bacterium]